MADSVGHRDRARREFVANAAGPHRRERAGARRAGDHAPGGRLDDRAARAADRTAAIAWTSRTTIDWKSPNTLLKAAFPFAASNPKATYDLGLGTIERRQQHARARTKCRRRQWADLTDAERRVRRGRAQRQQVRLGQAGRQRAAPDAAAHAAAARPRRTSAATTSAITGSSYSIAGHRGDWRDGRVPERAARAQSAAHRVPDDAARRRARAAHSRCCRSTTPPARSRSRALKKAEDSDEIVVRVQEQLRPRRPHARDDCRAGLRRRARSTPPKRPSARSPRPASDADRRTSRRTSRGRLPCASRPRLRPRLARDRGRARPAVQPRRHLDGRRPAGRRFRRQGPHDLRRAPAARSDARRRVVPARIQRPGREERPRAEGPDTGAAGRRLRPRVQFSPRRSAAMSR